MNDIDKMPSKCRDCPYWELAAEPYVCSDCTTPVKKCGGDYILRSDVSESLNRYAKTVDKTDTLGGMLRLIVRDIPAADVEPRRESGMWIVQPDRPNVESDRMYRCSVCGYADEHSPTTEVPYCWHCGSRMREMQKEDK